jgi:hypothetical protein
VVYDHIIDFLNSPQLPVSNCQVSVGAFYCCGATHFGQAVLGKLFKRHFRHAMAGKDVLLALRHSGGQFSGPLIIVWDCLSAHRNNKGNNPLLMRWCLPGMAAAVCNKRASLWGEAL